MRKFLLTLTFLVALLTFGEAFAEDTTTSKGVVVIIFKLPKPETNRPRVPSARKQYIEMEYTQSACVFNLSNVDCLKLSVEIENLDSGEIHYGAVDASYPVMDVYLKPATYSITCTTDDDCIYEGEFDVE